MKLFFPVILFLFILSSCVSIQSGGMSGNTYGANFVYEDLAFGEARSDRFLWLGGLRKDALLLEAKRDLMTARPLAVNEEYVNFTYDFKNSLILGFTRTKVSVSADIIRHTEIAPTERYSAIYQDKVYKASLVDSAFAIGDSVYTREMLGGVVLSNINNNRSRVLLNNNYNELITKRIVHKILFNKKGTWNGFISGDEIHYHDDMETTLQKGTIIGFGAKELLIRTKSGKILTPKKRHITIIADS